MTYEAHKLNWDIKPYNADMVFDVYRKINDGAAVKIAENVEVRHYTDNNIDARGKYTYYIKGKIGGEEVADSIEIPFHLLIHSEEDDDAVTSGKGLTGGYDPDGDRHFRTAFNDVYSVDADNYFQLKTFSTVGVSAGTIKFTMRFGGDETEMELGANKFKYLYSIDSGSSWHPFPGDPETELPADDLSTNWYTPWEEIKLDIPVACLGEGDVRIRIIPTGFLASGHEGMWNEIKDVLVCSEMIAYAQENVSLRKFIELEDGLMAVMTSRKDLDGYWLTEALDVVVVDNNVTEYLDLVDGVTMNPNHITAANSLIIGNDIVIDTHAVLSPSSWSFGGTRIRMPHKEGTFETEGQGDGIECNSMPKPVIANDKLFYLFFHNGYNFLLRINDLNDFSDNDLFSQQLTGYNEGNVLGDLVYYPALDKLYASRGGAQNMPAFQVIEIDPDNPAFDNVVYHSGTIERSSSNCLTIIGDTLYVLTGSWFGYGNFTNPIEAHVHSFSLIKDGGAIVHLDSQALQHSASQLYTGTSLAYDGEHLYALCKYAPLNPFSNYDPDDYPTYLAKINPEDLSDYTTVELPSVFGGQETNEALTQGRHPGHHISFIRDSIFLTRIGRNLGEVCQINKSDLSYSRTHGLFVPQT